MAYIAPTIGSAGLTLPTYEDIRDDLIESFKSIYGQDSYLEEDSPDYQWISAVASKVSDAFQLLQYVYNSRSPWTATGAALDSIVKLNGLTRKSASYSTCTVTVSGTPGAVIVNGVCKDTSGYLWDLPASVTIGSGGTVDCSAQCETIGAISALTGSITTINTPQSGWLSVTNADAAVVGQPIETDAQLRARQALSTRTASHTMLSGTVAAIAAVSGVTRYNVVENYTSAYDADGNPPHSVTCVVEGGTDDDVAEAIFYNRGIGCDMNGTTSTYVTDPDTGDSVEVKFTRPDYIPIYVECIINPFTGYTLATRTAIETALYNYLNDLQIGSDLTISGLYGAVMDVMEDITEPIFSITSMRAGIDPGALSTVDISVSFDEVVEATLSPDCISVTDGLSP